MAIRIKPMSEAEFTKMVIDLARLQAWRVAHFRAARTTKGWRTPVSGDGAGWPDLLLIRDSRIIAAELKVGRNKATLEQLAWLKAFDLAGAETYLWRPENWDEIVKKLSRNSNEKACG